MSQGNQEREKDMKTSELMGAALDWAVAMAENWAGAVFEVKPYSKDWAHGGPIIEREGISVDRMGLAWTADIADSVGGYIEHTESGATPLIAAMRCYVASKLGDEVEIPYDLVKE
jgi:hypothetical protein